MPSFLKDLNIRRRSKASFKTSNSSGNSSSLEGNEDVSRPANKSSSTLNSYLDRNSPPTTLSSSLSRSNSYLPVPGNKTPPPPLPTTRPRLPSSQSNRFSLMSMPTQNGDRSTQATSPFAPRVLSISDNTWVNQKVLLISGQCADPAQPLDGTVTVYHHQDAFPSIQWPACDSHFKALVHLQPGPNRIRLDFTSPRLPAPAASNPAHSSWININYLPLNTAAPLQLCMLLAKDSPETYDAVPDRVQKEGNGLNTALRKFKMAAYMWQAFTAEQMQRNAFGRRSFRYEEEWQPGTLSWRDLEAGQMRSELKIHVIRLDKTLAEIQDLDIAQQYEPAKRKGDLYSIAMDAVRAHFAPRPGHPQYVSAMFLDSHWDKKVGTIRAHAALGGGDDTIKLAIFGSHCLQSYPSNLEEVVPALTDCTRTDTNYVANDCNESGSNWEAVNIGIGAHLHEVGHLFGCPHQESGLMLRDFVHLNRTFISREPFSTRTRQQGPRLVLPKDEATWHRLDTLRFRYHPCFQLPADPPLNPDTSVQLWTVDNGTVLITAATGVAWIEIYPEGDELCSTWIEYIDPNTPSQPGPRHIQLTESQLTDRLPAEKRKKKLSLKIFSCAGVEHEVRDFSALASKSARVRLPDGRAGFRSSQVGSSQMQGSQPTEHMLGSVSPSSKKDPSAARRLLVNIRVHRGDGLDGLEFCYEDGETALFGRRGGRPVDFPLDPRRGELLLGFNVRAGFWLDAVQILTTTGRRSEMFGNPEGGKAHTFIPPRGYSIAGVYGSCGAWLDGFGLIITR